MRLNYKSDSRGLLTEINVDYANNKVDIVNHSDNVLLTAFGVNEHPTIKDFEDFINYRAIPQTRYRFKTEMRLRGIQDTSPMGICRYYNGRMADDDCYIEFLD